MDDDKFINSKYSPYLWSLEDCSFNRNEILNPLPDSYESMEDYKNFMLPLFYKEIKEPFNEFNKYLPKENNNERKIFLKNRATVVEVKNIEKIDEFDTLYSITLKMPGKFLLGFDKGIKDIRSSGSMKRHDLLYLAKTNNTMYNTYFEIPVLFKNIYQKKYYKRRHYSSFFDFDTNSDELVEKFENLNISNVKQYLSYDVICTVRMPREKAEKMKKEIEFKGGKWICCFIMSFGAIKKEYKALMEITKKRFNTFDIPIDKIITTGKFGNDTFSITKSIENTDEKEKEKENENDFQIKKEIVEYHHLNSSQKNILNKVLLEKFSLIQGPPGTGKTSTIISIIHCYLRLHPDTKILVCTPSNYAADEIYNRLFKLRSEINIIKPFRYNSKQKNLNYDDDGDRESNFSDTDSYCSSNTSSNTSSSTIINSSCSSRYISSLSSSSSSSSTIYKDENINILNINFDNANIIISTLCGSGNEDIKEMHDMKGFDFLIIDEAGQATELSTLIPLCLGINRTVLIGDHKQLPPTVKNEKVKRCGYGKSLFERLQNHSSENVLLLDTQYRMHPKISELSSSCFYDGKIKNGENVTSETWEKEYNKEEMKNKYGPVMFYDVKKSIFNTNKNFNKSKFKNNIYENENEANRVFYFIRNFAKSFPHIDINKKISVITPYNDQAALIKSKLKNDYPNIRVSSVDSFQGQENDIIIISTVRSKDSIGFLKDERRLNVMITRARFSLIIFGDADTLCQDENWKKIISKLKSRNYFESINSII